MRAGVLALLLPLAVSCSKDGEVVLVPVDGVVHLRDGPPLAGVTVAFLGPVPLAAPPATRSLLGPEPRGAARAVIYENPPIATTNALGRFQLQLASGRYEVWIGGPADSGIMSQHVATVTLRSSRVSLDLHYAGYRVNGAMRHLNVALASGHVFVLGATNTARAELRENGAGPHAVRTYSLLLPAGTFDFWANPNEGYWGVPRVKFEGITVSADTTIDLAVDGHVVEGTVTGPGGVIVYGAIVSATAPGASAWNQSDSNGRYGLHLPNGEYEFHVTPPAADTLQTLTVPGILIDAPRTLDFDLSPTLPPPAP